MSGVFYRFRLRDVHAERRCWTTYPRIVESLSRVQFPWRRTRVAGRRACAGTSFALRVVDPIRLTHTQEDIMVHRFRRYVTAAVFALGIGIAVPMMAPAQPVDTTTADRDDGGSWGWIGLLGLAGLAGLTRRSREDHPVVRPSTATR
jgi:MYXO-CTERM domain-containing protein